MPALSASFRILLCILLIRNHKIFLVQFGINQYFLIYSCLFILNCIRNHLLCEGIGYQRQILVYPPYPPETVCFISQLLGTFCVTKNQLPEFVSTLSNTKHTTMEYKVIRCMRFSGPVVLISHLCSTTHSFMGTGNYGQRTLIFSVIRNLHHMK